MILQIKALIRDNPIAKKLHSLLGPRLAAALEIFFLILTFEILFRFLFGFLFHPTDQNLDSNDILKAAWIGLRFDIRVAILLTFPWLLGTFIPFFNVSKKPSRLRWWQGFYVLLFAWITFTYLGDLGYYAYLSSRINVTIFQFMANMDISLQMLHQTYNLFVWTPVFLGFIGVIWFSLRYGIFAEERGWAPKTFTVKNRAARAVVVFVLCVIGIHSSKTQYPLRWSDAFFSQNAFVSALATNPIHYLIDTSKIPKQDYDANTVRKYYETVAAYLGVTEKSSENLKFNRSIPLTKKLEKPNIVYIVMESFASYKTGVFGNAAGASPELDALAAKGWLFKNFYTPTEGTARSMFCVLTGIPDINAKSTSSRNPMIVKQKTLFNAFKDWDKYYFLGGSTAWGNIRGVYQSNVENLQIYEEGMFKRPNTDVWGLSDLDLFREAAEILNARHLETKGKPFFALIQSASYHRPYTIPKDHGTFELRTLKDDEFKKYGFASNEEFNSFRFSDYSLGEFFKLIEKEPWFQNTVFVIHGDHGLPHMEAAHLPAGYKEFNLNRFHVPLVIYSPALGEPKVFDDIAMEPDVMPTLVGLIGVDATYSALGRNLLAPNNTKRYAFSYVYYTEPLQVMLYDQDYLAIGTEKEITKLYKYSSDEPTKNIKNQEPERFQEMSELLLGLFETSKYLLFHNK